MFPSIVSDRSDDEEERFPRLFRERDKECARPSTLSEKSDNEEERFSWLLDLRTVRSEPDVKCRRLLRLLDKLFFDLSVRDEECSRLSTLSETSDCE